MTNPALQGLRILDMTQIAAGPYATLLLGFMGAEVIKVESCTRMDINRGLARPTPETLRMYPQGVPGERPWNRTAHHIHRNVNKQSVTLDLGSAAGKDLFLKLVGTCDALFENYRASVLDRLGLGYDVLSGVNPQLVYVKISSQGATGPERDYGSLGSTLEQTAGLASITGYGDGRPLMTNETYPDPVVGLLAVGALMAALRRRRQTGKGTFVVLSQLCRLPARAVGTRAQHSAREHRVRDVQAEPAIALELRLVEELVHRALVGKVGVLVAVLRDILRLRAADSALDVEQIPDACVRVLGGNPGGVDILFYDIKRGDWATGGQLWSEMPPAKPAGT